MSKKHFIALADAIRSAGLQTIFTRPVVEVLADFCHTQNPAFDRSRWLDYIDGKCGPSGGRIR